MKRKLAYIILSVLMSFTAYSQNVKLQKANDNYEKYAYIDAIKIYERLAEKGYKSADMFQKLGNAFYFNAELEKANKWYSELFLLTSDVEPEIYYRYSQTLKSVGDYAKANDMMELFNSKSGNDQRAKLFQANKNYLEVIEENSGRYNIEDAGINSEYSDYGTSFFGNQLVFASSRIIKGADKRIQRWDNQSFTSLYSATVNGDGILQNPEKFAPNIDSKFNEDTPVFTNDSTIMYFTRNNFNAGKKGRSGDRRILIKLYMATYIDGKYTNVTELPFNSDEYSVAHPALSPDEKTLYFVSDMPGTFGQSDLFKAAISADGTFGTPVNLGNKINTEGKETFPFVSNDNELYFSSDGHQGLGGLDVFVSKITNDKDFDEVINVGKPINSAKDDFAFLIDTNTRNGFFSSNREGGNGYDDIYKFTEIRKLTCAQLLAGIVTDDATGEILADTKVTLLDEKMNVIKESYTDTEGRYSFEVECKKVYYVRAARREYQTKEQRIEISSETGKTDLPIALERIVHPVKVGDDLAKVFKIKIIYFDLDKSDIRPDAAFDLEKIVGVMKDNPTMKIDVRSHTDSRQTHKYNEALSDRRAKSTMAWIIAQGIDAGRITAKGYGETQLINDCADDVPCTEAQHQMNRRSEFIITAQ